MAIIPACKVSSSSSINSSNLSLDHIDSLSPFFCSVYSLACSFTNWDVSCDVRVCRVDRMTGRLVSCCFDLSCCCHLVWTRIVVVLTVTLECGDVRVNWVSVLSTLAPHIVGIVSSFFPLQLLFHPYCPVNWRACWCSTRLAAPEVIAGTSKPLYLLKFCFFWHTAISLNQFPTFLNMLLKTNQTSHSILWK